MRKEYAKICAACEVEFVANHPNTQYCPKCRELNKKHQPPAAEVPAVDAAKRTEKKKRPLSLTEAAVRARKAGMTYGQYIAKLERGE